MCFLSTNTRCLFAQRRAFTAGAKDARRFRLSIGERTPKKIVQKGSVRVDRRGYNKSGKERARFRASEPMPLLALADVRQTTCHPPRALSFGIIPTRPSCFYFNHPIPVCKV